MRLPLQLRLGAEAAEPKAWFVPGDSVAHWLEELVRCGLATVETRLFVVPQSVEDRTPAGLLIVPVSGAGVPSESSARPPAGLGLKPGRGGDGPVAGLPANVNRQGIMTPGPSFEETRPAGLEICATCGPGLPCKLIAGRLYVPADAVLHPPVTDEEVRGLCPLPVTFFHPVLGWSSFEDEACLRVADLLAVPEECSANWNCAQVGPPPLPELQGLILVQPPTLEDLFGDAPQEIGSEAPVDLPPAPNEASNHAVAKTRRVLQQWFAKGVAGAMRQLPHKGARQTWVNAAEAWANRQLSGVGQQLENLRHKELNRLLHLFGTDPEQALRHAIPMSAFAHRGTAPPSARLGPRPVNFNLNRLGGGRSADFWNIPGDMQQQLRAKYREMADREMQLGRYRRAAYIYAELLGDLASAANVLKQGKHFREAALIYDEHLKNPLEAVRCLVEGGMLAEAVERYAQMGHWLEVADLQERMGNAAAAQAALRRVVNERLAQQDILGAAKLVEERLESPEEALEMLLGAWPASRQASGCMGAAFKLLARLGRHEGALELLARLQQQPAGSLVMPLIAMLGGPARDYPHEPVRRLAADFSRVLIARQLSQEPLSGADAGSLMECLTRLAPQDRLLARDANRHLATRREVELRGRRVTPPPLPGNEPVLVRRFELPRQIQWTHLCSEWHFFFAVGFTAKHLTMVRGVWEGNFQSLSWECVHKNPGITVEMLRVEPGRRQGRMVILKDLLDYGLKRFPAADGFFGIETEVGIPAWLKRYGAIAVSEEGVWTMDATQRAILSCHDQTGKLLRTIDVTEELFAGVEIPAPPRIRLSAVGSQVAVAVRNRLVLTHSDGTLRRMELPGEVAGMFATLPHTRAGVAIMLEQGAVMHWLGTPGLMELERDVVSPQGVFVPGGPLVLVSESKMLLLDVDSRGVQKVTRAPILGQRPIGICTTASPGQFALLGAQGELTVYRVPQ
jgi:tetratricopeptide (TPR) repeat protein